MIFNAPYFVSMMAVFAVVIEDVVLSDAVHFVISPLFNVGGLQVNDALAPMSGTFRFIPVKSTVEVPMFWRYIVTV